MYVFELNFIMRVKSEVIHLYSGPFENFTITAKTPWWWHVWYAETCCAIEEYI